jgi:hypothetical protein
MKPINKKISNRGFTLLETLLYISLTALSILAITALFSMVFEIKVKQQAISEVEGEGSFVTKITTQTIRNSHDFGALTPGTTDTTLTLVTENPAKNPTTFSLSNGTIWITEGGNPAYALTTPAIIVTNLSFRNLGQLNTTGTIRVQFTLSSKNPSNLNIFDYHQIFYASASAR